MRKCSLGQCASMYMLICVCVCVCFLVEIGEIKGSLNSNLVQEEKYCLSY